MSMAMRDVAGDGDADAARCRGRCGIAMVVVKVTRTCLCNGECEAAVTDGGSDGRRRSQWQRQCLRRRRRRHRRQRCRRRWHDGVAESDSDAEWRLRDVVCRLQCAEYAAARGKAVHGYTVAAKTEG